MPHWLINRSIASKGFTIIEMAVIAPIVVLTIVAFVTFVINLVGDATNERMSNQLTYGIQDALTRIETDVKYSNYFIEQTDLTLTFPQGLNNDTTIFKNNTSNALILSMPSTSDNPMTSSSSYVYLSNTPYSCSSANVSQNSVLPYNVVYFVVNGTLWRRTIMRADYATAGCATPWQQPSCAIGQTASFCKTQDIRVLDNVTSFGLTYYSSPSSTTALSDATSLSKTDSERKAILQYAGTVQISISANATAGAKTISRSGSARVSKTTKLICPAGFIPVPGSSTYGTSDFCVMKYEAKSVGGVATSVAAGTPWVSITQTGTGSATTLSAAACTGCQLITEAQWMTIAQNVLSVPSNWSSGVVGTGYIFSGHNDNAPASALAADTDDNNGYSGTGNSASSGANQRRTLTLTNGEIIWDFAGNVLEWTAGQMTGGQPSPTGFAWREWTAVSGGTFTINPYPSNTGISGASTWNSTNGIGQIYSSSGDATLRGYVRSGHWYYGAVTGVATLLLTYAPTYTAVDLGFRATR